jgi:predicted transglutaminase-like cysteine proteinase
MVRRVFGAAMVIAALMAGSAKAASSMETGGLTSQPIGHFEFCKVLTPECRIKSIGVPPLLMGPRMMAMIESVNVQVNQAIKPETDLNIYGKDEVWAYPKGEGDCEDYVLLKRKILMNRGISPANLLITVVRKPDGEGHAVLTLRTRKGDYILDNLEDEMLPWEATEYRFLKRQSAEHTGHWVTIEKPRDILVGSVKR